MYLIGVDSFSFIRVENELEYYCRNINNEIKKIIYNVYNIEKASIYKNYDDAVVMLEKIKNTKEYILENDSIIGSIIDKNEGLDLTKLSIYELVVIKVEE